MSLAAQLYKTSCQTSDGNHDTSDIPTSVATAENISNLVNTLLSRFDELSKKLLNVKDVIIKNLQAENEHLRDKVSNLESKVVSLSQPKHARAV